MIRIKHFGIARDLTFLIQIKHFDITFDFYENSYWAIVSGKDRLKYKRLVIKAALFEEQGVIYIAGLFYVFRLN